VNVVDPLLPLPSVASIVKTCGPSSDVGMVNTTVAEVEVNESIETPVKELVCPDKAQVKVPVPPLAEKTWEPLTENPRFDGETVMADVLPVPPVPVVPWPPELTAVVLLAVSSTAAL